MAEPWSGSTYHNFVTAPVAVEDRRLVILLLHILHLSKRCELVSGVDPTLG